MKNLSVKLFVALTLTAAAGASFAAETSAQFDPKKCSIEYPKASLMNEEQGTTTASFLVTADGTVTESKIDKSSGFKNLDRALVKGLTSCKFKPGTKDGAPAQTWTKIDYAFKLD